MKYIITIFLIYCLCVDISQGTESETVRSVNLSDRIIIAECVAKETKAFRKGSADYFKFNVSDYVKGRKLPSNKLTLRLFYCAGPSMDYPFCAFETGKKYVLFLGVENSDGYPTLGDAYEAQTTASGEEFLEKYPRDIPLYHADSDRQYDTMPNQAMLQSQAAGINMMDDVVQELRNENPQTYKNFQTAKVQTYDVPPKNLPLKDFIFSLQKIVEAEGK